MKMHRMTKRNLSYYRRRDYNRVITGSVDSIIAELLFLPVEPEISAKILKTFDLHKFSEDLKDYIAISPSLSFNLLNLAHSSYFSENKTIVSFNDIIKIIGNDISVHLIKDLLTRSYISQDSDCIEFCKNNDFFLSLKTAHLSALISESIGYTSSFNAYIAGLIHNMGAVALLTRFPLQYSRLSSSAEFIDNDTNQVSSEDHALGINHCFMGARMVEHWDSFPFLSDAIFYHHHPLKTIKQSNKLVKMVYFSSMVYTKYEGNRSSCLETGKELFNLTDNQIEELISIADLKAQNRLLNLGIEILKNNSEFLYQPEEKREVIHLNEIGNASLLSILVDRVRKSTDVNERYKNIGRSINILTGIDEAFYFKHNAANKSLDGIRLSLPGNISLCDDVSVSIDAKESNIITSFLMGIEINSLERVDNTESALFDLQISNYMNTDGIYCLPLIYNERILGVIVFGINNKGININRERIERLRYFIELTIPYLADDDLNNKGEGKTNKNIESNLIQTRKLIHEINNPLSAIKNYLKVLNMKLDDMNVGNDEIRIIDDELDRISKLLKEFKSSPSAEKAEKSVSNINSIISDTILLIKNSNITGSEIRINFKEDENIPDIKIDKDAFRQVLINLINNAIEAMPQGGNITVDVRHKGSLRNGNLNNTSPKGDMEKIEISISDEGAGFPDHLKSNLFKKQSTTKSDHDGLGLLIVYELIKRMGGTVYLDDNSGKGACFKITLPVN